MDKKDYIKKVVAKPKQKDNFRKILYTILTVLFFFTMLSQCNSRSAKKEAIKANNTIDSLKIAINQNNKELKTFVAEQFAAAALHLDEDFSIYVGVEDDLDKRKITVSQGQSRFIGKNKE